MGILKNRIKRIEDRIIEKKPVKIKVTKGDDPPADFSGIVVTGDPRPYNLVYRAREIVTNVSNKVPAAVKNDTTDEPERTHTRSKKERVILYRGLPINAEIEPEIKPEAKKHLKDREPLLKGETLQEKFDNQFSLSSEHGHWDWD